MSGFASLYGSQFGTEGDDEIHAAALNNTITARAGNDEVTGGHGNDTIDAGDGNDVVLAGRGDDRLYGGTGDDLLRAGEGNDLVSGSDGDDRLSGGPGDDTIFGGNGHDSIVGGRGDDIMAGDAGNDTFSFGSDFGHDLILGFQIGQDVLQIPSSINGLSFSNASEVLPLVTDDGNGNALITIGGDTITLSGVSPGDLTLANISSVVHIV
jgi:Ca2+-binding RTX toxin-like protein